MSLETSLSEIASAIRYLGDCLKPQNIMVSESAKEVVPPKKAVKEKTKAAPITVDAESEMTSEASEVSEDMDDADDQPTLEEYTSTMQSTLKDLVRKLGDINKAKAKIREATGGVSREEMDPKNYAAVMAKFKKLIG